MEVEAGKGTQRPADRKIAHFDFFLGTSSAQIKHFLSCFHRIKCFLGSQYASLVFGSQVCIPAIKLDDFTGERVHFMTLQTIIDGINTRKAYLNTTNQQIADASGVSKATVDRILAGKATSPCIQNVLDIANVVGYDFQKPEIEPVETTEPALKQIIYVYEKRCEVLEKESRLKTVQSNMVIAGKDKWIRFLTMLSLALVAAIICLLLYDLTHLDRGWVR